MTNTVYVFIDASNLWEAQKVKGKLFDFPKLVNVLKELHGATSVTVHYYTAYPAEGTRSYSIASKHGFFTYLKKGLGFVVRKKELKRIKVHHDDLGDSVMEKGNMDVEITLDAVHNIARYDTAVFFTGDSDFLPLLTYIRNGKKKVYVYSSKKNVSEELRTGGDGYRDVLEMTEDIWGKDLSFRKPAT